MTLADQLKTRLEERRRSREGNDVTSPISTNQNQASSSFVPESIAVDIQRAVQVANESSKPFLFHFLVKRFPTTCKGLLFMGADFSMPFNFNFRYLK
jgi:hypothetical protein